MIFSSALALFSIASVVSAGWPDFQRQQKQVRDAPSLYRLQTERPPPNIRDRARKLVRAPTLSFTHETQQPGDLMSRETPLDFGDAGEWVVQSIRYHNWVYADVCCTRCPSEPVRLIVDGKAYRDSWNVDTIIQNAQEERRSCAQRPLLYDDLPDDAKMFKVQDSSEDPRVMGRLRGYIKAVKVHRGLRARIDDLLQPKPVIEESTENQEPAIRVVSWDSKGNFVYN